MEKTVTAAPREIAFGAIGAALIALCSWISIPLPSMVPFTLQTFGVCFAAAVLGRRTGARCVAAYVLLGAVGAPVFAGFRGGMGALLGPTGGYIIGFYFTALIVGAAGERWGGSVGKMAAAMALGVAVCYVFGTAWFVNVYSRKNAPVGILTALSWCVAPYLVPDGLKILLAALLGVRLRPTVQRGLRA